MRAKKKIEFVAILDDFEQLVTPSLAATNSSELNFSATAMLFIALQNCMKGTKCNIGGFVD